MVQPTRSPKTRLVFMARNLSSIEAQSASGEPDMAITRRTIERERGMTASRPAEAAPAPGPNTVMRSRSPWKEGVNMCDQL